MQRLRGNIKGQLSGAIAMIVGGAIVVGAAVYFGSLNTGWAAGM